ncbi:hypothetical protein [Actinotalea fermentans]|nr:hypothetical protein [Actinotalea fermentans]KGM17814.1 hypothetical protein N867_11485 [Actinotalea fermentans ATCC 43279 = JCM 9966 = DSM 3133]
MIDLTSLMRMPLHWEPDATRELWLKASIDDGEVFIRMNRFPEEHMYSLELGDGKFTDFDDFPPTWSRGALAWPETALPRWNADS